MIRIVQRTVLACLLLIFVASLVSGQNAPAGNTGKPAGQTEPATSSGVMQLKKQITGDFTYRFVSAGDKAASSSAVTPPTPLPAASGTDNVIAIAIPSTVNVKDATLEILDNGRDNMARLPVAAKGVVPLTESSFTFAQRVNVPIQSKGLGVVGAQVTMTSASKKFSQTRLLQSDDNGIARFDNVPLNEPVTVSVSYGSNPAESQTKTLTAARPADAWPPIAVTWQDAKTVTPPPVVQPSASSHDTSNSGHGADEESHSARQPESSPLNSLVSTVVSILFLCAVGYGIFWAYKTGRIKTVLDKLGVNTEPMAAASAGVGDPFAKPAKTPIQPITEGTADPFGGAAGSLGGVSAPPVATGPRLVATAGTYAGSIFPLSGAQADIGRDVGNAIPMPKDTNASRRHATIQGANGQFTLIDNGSSNGTFVNGVRIASQTPQTLRVGDEVQIGMTRFRFEA